ncbi:MAG: helix-turn-helix transcriptional regulator [Alphaproteobacteria bacterium]|nr:helix-turn-helix transcriptional regulator [Alphaproteobacteria bacterium]
MTGEVKAFGPRLKWWREHRGLSQLGLAGHADISQRHLSFLESGRAEPSREMVLRLAAVLDLPLRQQNALLLAAGFAPVWRESDLGSPELAEINRALDHMLAQQEPYPAFVVDRRWNLQRANAGAGNLVGFLLGAAPTGAVNLADALVAPEVLRPFIANWEDVAVHFLRSVQADALADGTPETAALLQRLTAYPGVPPLSRVAPLETHTPVLHIHFRKGETRFSVFTTIATLGTPQDVTLQEIRIECFFPSDAASAQLLRSRAGARRVDARLSAT